MKKEEIPQDDGALNKLTKEVVYAVDNAGKYTTELSTGWEVKGEALDVAWKDIEHRIENAKQKVLNNEASPLLYFMELRLMDMGIEPFLLASSLRGVLAQRLVRCLCPACKKPRGDGAWQSSGCEACGMTGFAGRTGVFELLEVDAACRAAIHQREAEAALRTRGEAHGMRSLQRDGQRLLLTGITSAEELAFATRSE